MIIFISFSFSTSLTVKAFGEVIRDSSALVQATANPHLLCQFKDGVMVGRSFVARSDEMSFYLCFLSPGTAGLIHFEFRRFNSFSLASLALLWEMRQTLESD